MPPMTIWRIFVGLSQLTCTCAIAPLGERHREVADAGLAGAERIGAVRRDRCHVESAGQDEVHDRQVVRREVPEHVDVGLDEPEVDADAVDEEDVAEEAVRDQLADLQDGRRVAVGVVGHQHEAALPRRLDHLDALRRDVGERLLDDDVLARLERREHDRMVRARRCRDGDRVDRRVARAPRRGSAVTGDSADAVGDALRPLGVEVADRGQVPVRLARKLRARFGPQ